MLHVVLIVVGFVWTDHEQRVVTLQINTLLVHVSARLHHERRSFFVHSVMDHSSLLLLHIHLVLEGSRVLCGRQVVIHVPVLGECEWILLHVLACILAHVGHGLAGSSLRLLHQLVR